MSADDVIEILATLRRIGGEPTSIEARRAVGGLPRSLRETLSAFSNTDGGTILLGVDEQSGFDLVELDDPVALRNGLVQMSRDDITPALQISTEIVEVEGHRLVVAEIPPAPADRRPACVTAQGIAGGSYLRGGDGDRRMTEAEIAMVMAARVQPPYDREPVDGSSTDHLDDEAVRRTLRRIRSGFPRLAQSDDATVLFRLGITAGRETDSPLTLAGLLTYGQFPQQFFPQLMVSVVVRPPEPSPGTRFLDNQTVRGSIPEMIETTLSMIRRNLAVRAVISDHGGRVDEIEYPLEAVREAVVNALMHRDYSPVTRGTQVQIELFPDRLVVRSPGGLYGGVLVDQELAVKEGGRRYAQYVLDPKVSGKSAEPDLFGGLFDDPLPGVDEALRSRGEATAGELVKLTGLSRTAVLNRLRTLTETGTVVAVGATRSPKRRYQWVEPISKQTR